MSESRAISKTIEGSARQYVRERIEERAHEGAVRKATFGGLTSGSWKKGQSPNPRGRLPARIDIAELARIHGPSCIGVVARLLNDKDSKIRLAAATALLDRGYGKPTQTIGADATSAPAMLHLLAAQAIGSTILEATAESADEEDHEVRTLLDLDVPTE